MHPRQHIPSFKARAAAAHQGISVTSAGNITSAAWTPPTIGTPVSALLLTAFYEPTLP